MPALIATLDAVTGLSPDITTTSTPCFSKYPKVSLAVSRISFSRIINAYGITGSSIIFPCGSLTHSPKTSIRSPLSEYLSYISV